MNIVEATGLGKRYGAPLIEWIAGPEVARNK